jgi:5'-3' exonuclease
MQVVLFIYFKDDVVLKYLQILGNDFLPHLPGPIA